MSVSVGVGGGGYGGSREEETGEIWWALLEAAVVRTFCRQPRFGHMHKQSAALLDNGRPLSQWPARPGNHQLH